MNKTDMKQMTVHDRHYIKFVQIIRIATFLLMAALIQISTATLAQKVTLAVVNEPMSKVFDKISKQTGFDFWFTGSTLKDTKPVTIDATGVELEKVLKVVFENQPVIYHIEDKVVTIAIKTTATGGLVTGVSSPPITIKGKVTDAKTGEPIAGVNISLKGTTTGTATDADGNYILAAPQDTEGVLLFSFIGYETTEEKINGRTDIIIGLQEKVAKVDEVVVVAFGTQKKSSMVSAIETINPGELKIPSSNLTTALAGRLAGVISYQESGEPGNDNASFFIRGVTTFGYKKDPLILIDGIEATTADLARLLPDDIQAFSILKDATATALYGARGANGVVQVSTKKGAEGPASISFRVENSFSANTQNTQFADPITYMKLANEAVMTRNPLAPVLYSPDKIEATQSPDRDPYLYPVVDWRKMLIKDWTINQRYNLNVGGGGKLAQYYISGSMYQDNGNLVIDKKSNFNNNINLKSYQLRSNITINLTKTTQLTSRLSGTFNDYNGPLESGGSIYGKIVKANPVLFPAYYPAEIQPYTRHPLFGNASSGTGGTGADYLNPYADLVKGYKDVSKSSIDAQFEIRQNLDLLIPGFSVSGVFNTTRFASFNVTRSYNPYYYNIDKVDPQTGAYTLKLLNEKDKPTEYLDYKEKDGDTNITSNAYFQFNCMYNKRFADSHDIGGLIVLQRRQQLLANQGSLQKSLPYRNQGISGRFTYGYKDRYLAEFTFGFNGSERFHKSHRYGFFPAIGAGWVISNEKFWSGFSKSIQHFKIRGTLGLVGNDAIGGADDRFFYLSDVNMNDGDRSYTFGENFTQSKQGVSIRRYENRNISWETARKLNLGIELGLFNDFNIIADYFTEYRYNILMDRAFIPANAGLAANVRANVGAARSSGFDMSLDYNRNFSNRLWLQGRGNFTYAFSRFDKFEEPDYNEKYKSHVGQSLGQEYGLIAERLFIDDAEVNNSPRQTYGEYKAGDIKYRDMNKDGQITDLDKVPIGYPTTPEIVYGFGFSLGYKGIDFSAFFQGSARSSFWIQAADSAPFQNNNQLLKVYADNHWSEENRNLYALWPRFSTTQITNNTNHTSTWFMRNGAFLRGKTVELGYSFPKLLLRRLRMGSARIYTNANNLFLLTDFKLWDVEMGGNGLGYPVQRVINIGFQVKF